MKIFLASAIVASGLLLAAPLAAAALTVAPKGATVGPTSEMIQVRARAHRDRGHHRDWNRSHHKGWMRHGRH